MFWCLEPIKRCVDRKFFSSIDSLILLGIYFNVIIIIFFFLNIPFLWFNVDIVMNVACATQEIDGEPRRPYLPYVTFTEVIWGEQRVQEIWERYRGWFFFWVFFGSFSLGGVFVSLYCGHDLRARLFSRALLRTATPTKRTFWLTVEWRDP